MTQQDAILCLLREGPKTLTQILASPYGLAAEYRRTMTDLRKEGFVIRYHRAKTCKCDPVFPICCPARVRGESVYRLESEPAGV